MNTDRLHTMINRYFSGDLDVKEERKLLEMLLSLDKKDVKAEEALAVMSWARQQLPRKDLKQRNVNSHKKYKIKVTLSRIITFAAASAAIIIGIFFYMEDKAYSTPKCYAYIEGKYTNDPEVVSSMIMSQLGEMSVASQETSNEVMFEFEEMSLAIKEQATCNHNNSDK